MMNLLPGRPRFAAFAVSCLAACCVAAPTAWAAAPAGAGGDIAPSAPITTAPAPQYHLGTEMVVRDWVLCISFASAEKLALAGEAGAEAARAAYAGLVGERVCGRFAELSVILREPLYRSSRQSDRDIRVFAAEVRLAGDWASAFVVRGGLPDD